MNVKDTVPLVAPDSVITCVSDAPEILAETVSVALELTAEVLTENVVDVLLCWRSRTQVPEKSGRSAAVRNPSGNRTRKVPQIRARMILGLIITGGRPIPDAKRPAAMPCHNAHMQEVNVGIVGLGNVGSGTLAILAENAEQIALKLGFRLKVAAVCSRSVSGQVHSGNRSARFSGPPTGAK